MVSWVRATCSHPSHQYCPRRSRRSWVLVPNLQFQLLNNDHQRRDLWSCRGTELYDLCPPLSTPRCSLQDSPRDSHLMWEKRRTRHRRPALLSDPDSVFPSSRSPRDRCPSWRAGTAASMVEARREFRSCWGWVPGNHSAPSRDPRTTAVQSEATMRDSQEMTTTALILDKWSLPWLNYQVKLKYIRFYVEIFSLHDEFS